MMGNAKSETYHTCAGFISTVPATISTQGVWCLRQDLSTSVTSGAAITIATNNVTIDCNNFKIGGLGAGPASLAVGIRAADRQSVTIRNCNVRGFQKGIELVGGAGHLVEDNRLDNNLNIGILLSADSGMIRGNQVFDTGGGAPISISLGSIFATSTAATPIAGSNTQILGNVVQGTIGPSGGVYYTRGILAVGSGVSVRDNIVGGLTSSASSGTVYGIDMPFSTGMVRDNVTKFEAATGTVTSIGISTESASQCRGNFVLSFDTSFEGCIQP
jgi:parallel beta-helix repeat protein